MHTKKVVLVFGNTRSGKTALSFKVLESIKKHKKVYVYKHPLPKAIDLIGFNNMSDLSEFSRVSDCAVYIDEPQLTFPKEDKKSNTFLSKLYTLAGQRNITIILSTSDSRWVSRGTESFVESWFIKDCEAELLKNGSNIKNIIKNQSTFGMIDFKLDKPEFLFYDRGESSKNGKYVFKLPTFWNDVLSTPFKNCD